MNRTVLIVAAVWIGAVSWYWACGPLRPDDGFMLPQGRGFVGLSPAGELMLMGDNGPLEFWSIPDLRKTREAFAATDDINAYYHGSDGRTLIGRAGKTYLANLSTGEVLDELPGLDRHPKGEFTFRGDRLIYRGDERVSIYDLAQKRLVAEHPDRAAVLNVSQSYAVTRTYSEQENGAHVRETHLIDLESGRLDNRLKPLGPIDHITISPNEKFAVATQGAMNTICELESGKVLWKTAHLDCQYFFRFEKGGDVVAADVTNGEGRVQVVRWHSANGQLIDPPPLQIVGPATREPLGTSGYALDCAWRKKAPARSWVDHGIERARISMGLKARWFLDRARCTTLVDCRSGLAWGLEGDVLWAEALPDGRGVITADINNLERGPFSFYSLPPLRDWSLLVRWALAPTVLGIGLLRWWQRRRRGTTVPDVRSLSAA